MLFHFHRALFAMARHRAKLEEFKKRGRMLIDQLFSATADDALDFLTIQYYEVKLVVDIGEHKAGAEFACATVDYQRGLIRFFATDLDETPTLSVDLLLVPKAEEEITPITLTPKQFAFVLDLIENAPAPPDRLREAFKRHAPPRES